MSDELPFGLLETYLASVPGISPRFGHGPEPDGGSGKPLSPPPYLNGGTRAFLSWVMDCADPVFAPAAVTEWLEGVCHGRSAISSNGSGPIDARIMNRAPVPAAAGAPW